MIETYQIRVRGHLDDRWLAWFENATIRRQDDGTTVLFVALADQAALHGVIARIRDLGLPLLSISRVTAPCENP